MRSFFGLLKKDSATALSPMVQGSRTLFRRAAAHVDKLLRAAKPRRHSDRAAHDLRAGKQPQNREIARPDDSAGVGASCERGDSVDERLCGCSRLPAELVPVAIYLDSSKLRFREDEPSCAGRRSAHRPRPHTGTVAVVSATRSIPALDCEFVGQLRLLTDDEAS